LDLNLHCELERIHVVKINDEKRRIFESREYLLQTWALQRRLTNGCTKRAKHGLASQFPPRAPLISVVRGLVAMEI
jgi:hypothetical protein